MGTRNLTCVQLDGAIKVAQYCQWDGYPSGQGRTIRDFIIKEMDKKLFCEKVRSLKQVTDRRVNNLWKKCGADGSGLCSLEVSKKFRKNYPQFHRDTGAEILKLIQEGKTKEVFLELNFAKDSLFCEYCYVVNLDNDILEVYEGVNKTPLNKKEKFYSDKPDDEGYYPVKLKKKFAFKKLKPLPNYFKRR